MVLERKKQPQKVTLFRPGNKTLQTKQKISKTDPWVEYWNLQPGLVVHRPDSKVYKRGAQAVQELLKGLSPRRWDMSWLNRWRIYERVLHQPWSQAEVKRSIRLLSKMTEPGNWPGPDTWLSQLALADAVYNARSCTSMLVLARCSVTPKKLKTYQDTMTWEKVSPQAQTIAAPLRAEGIEIWPSIAEKMARRYNNLCQENPLLVHLSGGLEGFGRMLARWLHEQNNTNPGTQLEPPDGKLWKMFLSSFS